MTPTILITRPEGSAEAFADQLRSKMGCAPSIVISPLLTIEYAKSGPSLEDTRTLIFTSAHAVHALAAVTTRRDLRCYTVGYATADTAKKAGFRAVAGPGHAADLAQKIIEDAPEQPCLYLRGDHVAYELEPVLNNAGIETRSSVIYRQINRPLSEEARRLLERPERVILPLFSPRSASILFDSMTGKAEIYVAAMSISVAQCVPMSKVAHVDIAERPSLKAMVDTTERLWHRSNQLEGNGPAQ